MVVSVFEKYSNVYDQPPAVLFVSRFKIRPQR
jgi:hypothetical protein